MDQLQIQCRKLSYFNYEMTALVPVEQVQKAFDQSYRRFQKRISVPGFRKGKVPFDYIRKNHLSEIEQNALKMLVESTYTSGLKQYDLKPVGHPQLDVKPIKEGQKFEFKAQFEIHPDPEVKNFENLKIKAKKPIITADRIQQVIDELRDSSAKQIPVEEKRPCQKFDIVHIDISGVVDGGEKLPPQENMPIELGKNLIFKDIEQALLGLKVEEEKKVDTQFPKTHPQFPNKKVIFNVKLKKIFKKEKPELNDKWAQTLKMETVEKLKQNVEDHLKSQAEQDYQNEIREKILNELVTKNQFDVPPSVVKIQKEHLIRETQKSLKKQGAGEEQVKKFIGEHDKDLIQKSLHNVKAGYLIQALAKKLNIEEDIEQTRRLLENNAHQTVDSSMVESFHWQRVQSRVLDTILKKSHIDNK